MELNSKKHKAVCAVALCSSPKEQTVVYHRFPLNEEVRKKWIVACKRDDKNLNPSTASVCSTHFLSTDYERDLRNELLGIPIRKKLKKNAVPSQKIRLAKELPIEHGKENQRENRQQNRQQKKLIESPLGQGNSNHRTKHVRYRF